jgi:hypothetical protein
MGQEDMLNWIVGSEYIPDCCAVICVMTIDDLEFTANDLRSGEVDAIIDCTEEEDIDDE